MSPFPDIEGGSRESSRNDGKLKFNTIKVEFPNMPGSKQKKERNWRQVTPTIYDKLDPNRSGNNLKTISGGFYSNPIKAFN